MRFTIDWKEGAVRQLERLQDLISKRIYKKVGELKEDVFSKDVKKLRGENAFRLRIGDYRVIFDMDIKNKVISILKIGHRKKIYKR